MPHITGLLETALYVDNMARSVAFFEGVLGLKSMLRSERLTAFDAGNSGVLLIFKRGASVADMPSSSGIVPGHDGSGPLHMAFAISADSYDEWRAHLAEEHVTIYSEVRWPRGGRSVYFHDPDGHVLELPRVASKITRYGVKNADFVPLIAVMLDDLERNPKAYPLKTGNLAEARAYHIEYRGTTWRAIFIVDDDFAEVTLLSFGPHDPAYAEAERRI